MMLVGERWHMTRIYFTFQGLQALAAGDPNVGPCVVRSCGLALASCLADPTCVENLVCLQVRHTFG